MRVKSSWLIILVVIGIAGGIFLVKKKSNSQAEKPNNKTMKQADSQQIKLPQPETSGDLSLEETLAQRRSKRDFKNKPLSLEQVSQILWAAQGITDKEKGFRTAPSAGALYPLEIYIAVKNKGVKEFDSGVYHYSPEAHALEEIGDKEVNKQLAEASLGQSFIAQAPISLIITAQYSRVTNKYGERGRRYVHMEAGHTGQNIYLQAEGLCLGTVSVGAFGGQEIIQLLGIPKNHKPLYVLPIGYPE